MHNNEHLASTAIPQTWSVHFGLKPVVWTAASAIYRVKNIIEAVEADRD
jgi:hypothetical protein